MPRRKPAPWEGEPEAQAPPHNLGAEQQVLGGMLVSPETIPTAVSVVNDHSFYDRKHRLVFQAIYRLWSSQVPVDGMTVGSALQQTGDFDAAGGTTELATLMNAVVNPTPDLVAYHAGLVRDAWVARQVMALTRDARDRAAKPGEDPGKVIHDLLTELECLAPKVRQGELISPGITLAELREKNPQLPPFLVEGIVFHGGDGKSGNTALLSGPPGVSKTWAMLHMARAVATGEPWFGIPTTQARVAIFELEMSEAEIEPRCQALDQGDPSWREQVLLFSKDQIPGGQLDLCDTPTLLLVIRLVRDANVKLVIFDNLSHLHFLNENNSGEANRVMAALDRISAETGCAVLVLHHDRKGLEGQTKRQTGDSVRGSTVFLARPGAILGLSLDKGRRLLQFHKVRGRKQPDPIYLEEMDDGHLEVTEAPEDQRRVRVMRLNAIHSILAEEFESVATIMQRLVDVRHVAISERRLREDLTDLVGDGRAEKQGGGYGQRIAFRRATEEVD